MPFWFFASSTIPAKSRNVRSTSALSAASWRPRMASCRWTTVSRIALSLSAELPGTVSGSTR
jgi:hypothetical protein